MIAVTADGRFKENIAGLTAGDEILLSGTVYTARDAAHKLIARILDEGGRLPFSLEGALIYYAGPTQAPAGMPIGSCGPTTSCRMDGFAPRLYDLGLAGTIGKGARSAEVAAAIARNRAIYLCALGGCGALAAKSVKKCEIVAFSELGCEAVRKLEIENFPLIVGIDSRGNSVFDRKEK